MNPIKLIVALAAISMLGVTTSAVAENASIADHMHEHHAAMIKIQNAIIAGSLVSAREPATWLAEHAEPAGLPPAGDVFVAAVRESANAVLSADSLETAAEATSRMGLACGNCHVASSVEVVFDETKNPSEEIKDKPHMQRHQWAADRMWEGLIGPSDRAWSRGGNLLFESPIKPDALAAHGGGDETQSEDDARAGEANGPLLVNRGGCKFVVGDRQGGFPAA